MSTPAVAADPVQFSRPKSELNVLLLEGVDASGVDSIEQAGFGTVEVRKTSLTEADLIAALDGVHYLGIRSRTQLTRRVLEHARELRAIGCFCIGTNQVDLDAARELGIPVFNAPFSNTRSVAELVLAEAILLMRDIPSKNANAHRGIWQKSASGAYEVRGKALGIVGYGHIGTQVGLLAESIGMRVYFYDVESKLSLGNATQLSSLTTLLQTADVVTLHVPESAETRGMFDAEKLAKMKPGACLINASRGTVIDIDALVAALESGHLGGSALDVFPIEPRSNTERFESPLCALDNVILTPHVGGSTVEAQQSIGVEVAEKIIRYNDNGSTVSAVNFPEVALPPHLGTYRLLHIHRNQPGVMAKVNQFFSDLEVNISGEYLQTNGELGYVVVDFDIDAGFDITKLDVLKEIDGTLRARIIQR